MSSGRRWRRIHGKHAKLSFLLNHERDEITGIADDEAGIRAVKKASMSLFLGANLREEHSRCSRDHPSVMIA
jgi:hypothetical protein